MRLCPGKQSHPFRSTKAIYVGWRTKEEMHSSHKRALPTSQSHSILHPSDPQRQFYLPRIVHKMASRAAFARSRESTLSPDRQERLETLLSAHSMMLPMSEHGLLFGRASATAALSEVYPQSRVERALDFVQLVKRHLAGRPGIYDQLFKALKLYEEDRCVAIHLQFRPLVDVGWIRVELIDVLVRIMIMCVDAQVPVLLERWTSFLPDGYYYVAYKEAGRVELHTPHGIIPRQLVD
ncbi:hypothetical protein BD413DRAFT_516123 [Trametes elegans]|nr:hypothetical protein BD413DRAFT_516123 [Trametes elegans]